MKSIFGVAVLLLIVVVVNQAEAKSLFVDQSVGNDGYSYIQNDNEHPWETISRAAWGSTDRDNQVSAEAAQAGDTVIVRSGTYLVEGVNIRYDPALNPANSGSRGLPITFQSEGSVTIRPSIFLAGTVQSATAGSVQLDANASAVNDAYAGWYIRIVSGTGSGQSRKISQPQGVDEECIIAGSYNGTTRTALLQTEWDIIPDSSSSYQLTKPGPLIGALNRDYVIWQGFTVIEGDSYRSDTGPVVVWSSENISLVDLEIVGTPLPLHHDNHNAIRLEYADNVVVRDCIIHGFHSNEWVNNPQNESAVTIYHSNNSLFENNLLYDNFTGFFPKAQVGGHIFRKNIIRNCVKAFRVSYHVDVDFYQNIIDGCTELAFQPAESNSSISIYNNTIYNTPSGVDNWFASSGFDLYNNLFSSVDFPFDFEGNLGTFTSDYNLYHQFTDFVANNTSVGELSSWQAMGYDQHSMAVDPSLVDPINDDFHLQPGSPAVNAGQDGVTIGAYITGDELLGPVGGQADYCGDAICNGVESCLTCSWDCGSCTDSIAPLAPFQLQVR